LLLLAQGELGVLPSNDKLYRARQIVLGELDVDSAEKYQLMESLLQEFAALNPGSIARMERDDEDRFFRYILMEGDAVAQVRRTYFAGTYCV